ncbi:MAG: toll/interleukin-1 receptor domain-containing protein [Desulfobacteraceae bacterium]|nr:MAG: toll/interleukin-1 receptor domain-containing protein [Desulfobacteraceae bacterium]
MYAFISYQTADKAFAGKIKNILKDVGIASFLAHEDINVSEEWRQKILEEIGKADLFISLWSANYNSSPWCIQESGIASFRKEMTIIPLSIDESIPQGFAGNIQAKKRIDLERLSIHDLMTGIIKADLNCGIEIIFTLIAGSMSFRGAEDNFKPLLPYIDSLSQEQGKKILEIAIENKQVHHATLCAREYLPPLMDKFGHLLSAKNNEFLKGILAEYAAES